MNNVLRFRSFHERHFSPDQVRYWQSILNQQSNASQWQQYGPAWSQHAEATGNENYEEQYYGEEGYEEEYVEEGYEEEYGEEGADEQPQTALSEEAIEIFKFSEAYRKEREEAEAQEEEEEHDKWITDAYRNGVEAPTSCLVHHANDDSSSAQIRVQEHLLDSEYLSACRDGQAVLWPVLPLRL